MKMRVVKVTEQSKQVRTAAMPNLNMKAELLLMINHRRRARFCVFG